MRTRTFVLSFLVHSCVIIAAMVVRLFAATELPDPPRSTSFMMAAATVPPDVPPPPAPRKQAETSAASHTITPIRAPDSIAPELPNDIPDGAPPDGAVPSGSGEISGGLDVGPPTPPAPEMPLVETPARANSSRTIWRIRASIAPMPAELEPSPGLDGIAPLPYAPELDPAAPPTLPGVLCPLPMPLELDCPLPSPRAAARRALL